MKDKRLQILVIAGYDPSAGAGILADVKTAESNSVYAYAVCTGFTFQNSSRIAAVRWFSEEDISTQIRLCCEDTLFEWVKLGITQDPSMLAGILGSLRKYCPGVKIIWDPVLSSSSGTTFMEGLGAADFERLLPQVFMITPNLPELYALYPAGNPEAICARLSRKTIVYLKGGHDKDWPGRDRLFIRGVCHTLASGIAEAFQKHGSGCVLSTALTANLAREFATVPVEADSAVVKAALKSKQYTEAFLNSHPGRLGWHKAYENE
ncbi:hydroxymethylpyrimidine/phosphomethylpyrimidine kinase [Anseongella ginsenosidimutans]|uniref:hydroxymethylpyrimidine kinase n=1 Tax=Anseongella ginsenosidimutans TaxID=496056 RepID=A0A4R3KNX1_9SPHI|nr:hydroxymethylpyrimidine/phosphomethylpyrimidine kinase [Anseongella ginsenosidimutans]QEC53747.1 hydroxymethylpyrimidine/phosphomethylpyrimidine kinase [Anseongella ginsenosidimutans]TCS85997.1 hydroxymethylpyrimidine/phosphomethylpyrimidine kinase [Anseongella ginsenosidimutans]